ncbi:phosphatase PAP2 family protein [Actinomadura sp. HBU206391]|uniref:phosphatase PAP2 family protein n=1 Tax=Actinomadura sp. HBU206391 TaxID=2731692 RepID=UPI00164F5A45|nr:phosphatase PAP2 family protein [Actinomadura sp. HBU206391]MBC6461595.1 phosphatase PAP2 family protein [Actinomadura sp. HBU206391]
MVRSPASLVSPSGIREVEPDRRSGRPRLWAELLLIAVCYGAYSVVRNLVPTQHAAAMQRAHEILEAERALHLDFEFAVNQFFVDTRWLGVTANYYYATLHFIVTIGVLVWLYAWHPHHYVTYRWLLFGTTITALIGFWFYPLAPPRFLPGYVDTVVAFNTWGLYDSSPIATVSNQYAAMPSLHTAWSLWCALAVITIVRSRWVKIVAAGYPIVTVVVILGTSNHFILDAVGGGAVLAGGYVLTQTLTWAAGPAQRLCRIGVGT